MAWLSLILFEKVIDFAPDIELPFGCKAFGAGLTCRNKKNWLQSWINDFKEFEALLVLAGSLTAEVEGISAAGSTAASRRYTAVADAELLLNGPLESRCFPLPPLPAGVSPALISYVASRFVGVSPLVLAVGLHQTPSFPYLCLELPIDGPAACLSTGHAMRDERVESLWKKGFSMGIKLRKPLLLAECVPGGTTTAQAVLTGLGISVSSLISGSVLIPPIEIKTELVAKGLRASHLGLNPSPKKLLAAVGDPFQPVAVGLLLGARQAGQQVLLGGGCQMLAVLALALAELNASLRSEFVEGIVLGTTAWLTDEGLTQDKSKSSLVRLLDIVGDHFGVGLVGMSSGLRFDTSRFEALRDYEKGYVKEGVGAGAFALLAQFHGASCKELVHDCEVFLEELLRRPTS